MRGGIDLRVEETILAAHTMHTMKQKHADKNNAEAEACRQVVAPDGRKRGEKRKQC